MADYTQIDPLEFLRATQRHAAPQQQAQPDAPAPAQHQPQGLPPAGAGQARMSGQVGQYFGPASQALMAALTGQGNNPQANIAAMTQNPALANAVNGASGSYAPHQTVTTPRIQWGAPGSDPSSVSMTGGQPITPPDPQLLPLNGTTPTPPGTMGLMGAGARFAPAGNPAPAANPTPAFDPATWFNGLGI